MTLSLKSVSSASRTMSFLLSTSAICADPPQVLLLVSGGGKSFGMKTQDELFLYTLPPHCAPLPLVPFSSPTTRRRYIRARRVATPQAGARRAWSSLWEGPGVRPGPSLLHGVRCRARGPQAPPIASRTCLHPKLPLPVENSTGKSTDIM